MCIRDRTQVDIVTDLKVSGKVAQFGRGVMQDISTKLLGQFADCLEQKIKDGGEAGDGEAAPIAAASDAAAAAAGTGTPQDVDTSSQNGAAAGVTPTPTADSSDDDDVLDLGDIGLGSVVAKQAAPALGALAVVWLIFKFFRRGSGKTS